MIAVVFFQFLSIRGVSLSDQDRIILVGHLAQLFKFNVILRQFVVVFIFHLGIAQISRAR